MSTNLVEHNTTPGVSLWRDWSYPQFIEKNSQLLFDEVYKSLDDLLTVRGGSSTSLWTPDCLERIEIEIAALGEE